MDKDSKISAAKQELYQALAYYIERQQLVVQAMLDLKLDLNAIGKFGALAWGYDESSETQPEFSQNIVDNYHRELLNARKYASELKVPRKGIWMDKSGHEWKYHLHGGGCLLENVKTEEPLDWDCPNPEAFDSSFFSRHLDWRLITNRGDNEFMGIRELLNEYETVYLLTDALLEILIQDGLIEGIQVPMGLVYTLRGDS